MKELEILENDLVCGYYLDKGKRASNRLHYIPAKKQWIDSGRFKNDFEVVKLYRLDNNGNYILVWSV